MKIVKSLLLILFFPFIGFAQSLNGIYTGVLSNDSTTIRQDQSFELALTEYNGKVYGYAYSTFIINDTLYYIVKRVKGKIEGDICEVEDDEVVSHNFRRKPEKKVFVTYTLRRNNAENAWRLDGNWKTNLTKKYYAISGKVETKEEKDLSKSKLYEHLGDLDLQKTLALSKPKEKEPEKKAVAKYEVKEVKTLSQTDTKSQDKKTGASIVKSETNIPGSKTTPSLGSSSSQEEQKDVSIINAADKKPGTVVIQSENKASNNKTVSSTNNQIRQTVKKDIATANEKKPEPPITKQEVNPAENKTTAVAINPIVQTVNQPNANEKKNVASTNTVDKKPENSSAKQETKLPDLKTTSTATNNQPIQNEKKDVAASEKKPGNEFEFQELKRTNRSLKAAASMVDGRATVPSETIYFKSDSLSIALYDNGEVDGDTVSVIINDEMFIEKQGLKSTAFRKTFFIPQTGDDSLLVVLYAENLGKYPPNTGLLQIKDGEEIFYVRFKADLDKNAAIVLRRKSK